jgi:hypothetical protein
MAETNRQGSAERERQHRARMRAQGLRLRRVWVPDQRDPAVRARIQRQLAALRGDKDEDEALTFIERATADMDWDA